jgi:hypothetical protein
MANVARNQDFSCALSRQENLPIGETAVKMFAVNNDTERSSGASHLLSLLLSETKPPTLLVVARSVGDGIGKLRVNKKVLLQFLPPDCQVNSNAVVDYMEGIFTKIYPPVPVRILNPRFRSAPFLRNHPVKHFSSRRHFDNL